MTEKEINTVEKIRSQYKEREITKLDELKALDKKSSSFAKKFSYVFGAIGSLVMGVGMCLAMPEVIEGYMPLGIAVGAIGIAMVSCNYFIYKKLLARGRAKNKDAVLKLTQEICNG